MHIIYNIYKQNIQFFIIKNYSGVQNMESRKLLFNVLSSQVIGLLRNPKPNVPNPKTIGKPNK